MFTLRGQPVIYYGDEQGFIGDGGDKDARQDMFASQVASYNDDAMVGGAPTGSRDRFGTNGVVFRDIASLSQLRASHRALQDGAQITRFASDAAGIFAVSRIDAGEQIEYLVVANNSDTTKTATFATYTPNGKFRSIYGGGDNLSVGAEGQVTVSVPAMTVRVYPRRPADPAQQVGAGDHAHDAVRRRAVGAGRGRGRQSRRTSCSQVTFAYRQVGATDWTPLGTDDNPTYRVFHDVSGYRQRHAARVPRDRQGQRRAHLDRRRVGHCRQRRRHRRQVAASATSSSPTSCRCRERSTARWAAPATGIRPATQAQLTLDPNDKIWKGTYTLPAEHLRLQGRDQQGVGRELRRGCRARTAPTSS